MMPRPWEVPNLMAGEAWGMIGKVPNQKSNWNKLNNCKVVDRLQYNTSSISWMGPLEGLWDQLPSISNIRLIRFYECMYIYTCAWDYGISYVCLGGFVRCHINLHYTIIYLYDPTHTQHHSSIGKTGLAFVKPFPSSACWDRSSQTGKNGLDLLQLGLGSIPP